MITGNILAKEVKEVDGTFLQPDRRNNNLSARLSLSLCNVSKVCQRLGLFTLESLIPFLVIFFRQFSLSFRRSSVCFVLMVFYRQSRPWASVLRRNSNVSRGRLTVFGCVTMGLWGKGGDCFGLLDGGISGRGNNLKYLQ